MYKRNSSFKKFRMSYEISKCRTIFFYLMFFYVILKNTIKRLTKLLSSYLFVAADKNHENNKCFTLKYQPI